MDTEKTYQMRLLRERLLTDFGPEYEPILSIIQQRENVRYVATELRVSEKTVRNLVKKLKKVLPLFQKNVKYLY
jgi:hypothetical protein